MGFSRPKNLFSLIMLISLAVCIAVFLWTNFSGDRPPQTTINSPPQKIVEEKTKVYIRENYSLCSQIGYSCKLDTQLTGNERKQLDNLAESEILKKYPPEAGWTVSWQGSSLYLAKDKPGLCPEHQKRWHLGLDSTEKKIAVYLGPAAVGNEGGLVRETDLLVDLLPADLQQRVRERTIEFLSWEELIATLDSLAEYAED